MFQRNFSSASISGRDSLSLFSREEGSLSGRDARKFSNNDRVARDGGNESRAIKTFNDDISSVHRTTSHRLSPDSNFIC